MPRHPGDVLITVDELAAALGSGRRPVLLDVRWRLGDPDGRRHHLAGHLPGAVYVDLDTELSDPPTARDGRHPLPDVARLQAAARRWGISDGTDVVAYDDTGNLAAARAWWLLTWAGVTGVRLLDGGYRAWRDGGGAVEQGDVQPAPGTVTLRPGALPVVDADGAARTATHGVLLDARAAERYRGDQEPVDPRAGHIPGAVSAPTTDNLTPDGRFRPAAELAERFARLGAGGGPVAVYCGSGVTASHQIAALRIAGLPAALYPGSWSQWSNEPGRPVATGDDNPRG
ncbi:sulfurtransferase [Solwaraspora sp. WMMD1047]|uniref:sulfurtransferase n=1 Tax=Solwaraspora sp. WMMD1047 TaxID=3016102 RepID=UPI002417D418|nr:sulfurtransferase [Solwaraspora sp. WMMD1047]MDG4830790.1 sulfurtransferase [Solwaraspora sp. WMMD1047]